MGGHGALTIFLKNRDKYRSVSCFAPISNLAHPECSLGQKALSRYLGADNKESWSQYSAVDLLNQLKGKGQDIEIYVDQGTEDVYWKELRIDDLKQACAQNNVKLTLNMREGYSHGYWFVQTFIEDHIQYHAKRLLK
jgi:S-formylglutathione hydrolase